MRIVKPLIATAVIFLLLTGCVHPTYNVRVVDGNGDPLVGTPVSVTHSGLFLSKSPDKFETTTNDLGIATIEVASPDQAMVVIEGQRVAFNTIRHKKTETVLKSNVAEESARPAILIKLIEE
ncbi:MAG: hypothetical protein WBF93_19550 [Pirellulales bacterium]